MIVQVIHVTFGYHNIIYTYTASILLIHLAANCTVEETSTIFGDYSWPDTQPGTTYSQDCALGASVEGGLATRLCQVTTECQKKGMCFEIGEWQDPDFSQCNDEFDTLLDDVSFSLAH